VSACGPARDVFGETEGTFYFGFLELSHVSGDMVRGPIDQRPRHGLVTPLARLRIFLAVVPGGSVLTDSTPGYTHVAASAAVFALELR
jgi:hypothetical protein